MNQPAPGDVELAHKAAWASFNETVLLLLECGPGALSLRALLVLRRELRTGMWQPSTLPAGKGAQRAVLLNAVAEAVLLVDPAMRPQLELVGDVFGPAPDDASDLGA